MVECISCTAIYNILPVISFYTLVQIHVLIFAEILCVRAEVVLVLKQSKLILPLGIVISVQNIELLGYGLPAVVCVVADIHLAALAALGGYEDNTIGTTRTIDSC